jgi:glucose/arabinose dehydrogenase
MRRRLILVGVLAIALAACGGSSASPSASSASTQSPSEVASSSAPPVASVEPSIAPAESAPAITDTATSICGAVVLRKQPSSASGKVKVIATGTAVHVVETVAGTAYTAGSCGTSGSDWLKIDQVGGKSVKTAYGVQYVYAAAGFFQ